jgi:AcrR family transcriptional regulator
MATRRASVSARDRLLDVAGELFYREGIRAVGIDTIIARAGVAKASLYNHFKSKDELIAAWLERKDAEFSAWFVAAVERRASEPRERLLAVFDALHEWFRTSDFRGCAFLNSCAELPDPSHPARSVIVTAKRRTRDYLRAAARR